MKKILPAEQMPPPSFPRPLAVDILMRVEMDGAFAEPLIDQCLDRGSLADERDRRLLTELVYGTLRMQGYLDWLIGQYCRDGIRSLEPAVRNTLRIALYQRYFTERIPDFAIVNEAVAWSKKVSPRKAALVNAVLRNIMRQHDTAPMPDTDEKSTAYMAIAYSHPPWLVKLWQRQWGPEETAALCRANNQAPAACARVNRLRATRETVIKTLAAAGITARETFYSSDGLLVAKGGYLLRHSACFPQGLLQIQDEASQMIARLVAPAAGERVLDLCAGIGGKATHLAEIMGNRGRITAVDISEGKLAALNGLSARLGCTIVSPLAADALEDLGKDFHGAFDRVLVDVPCSGTGTLRRAPEIKWRLQPSEIKALTAQQEKLLRRAATYVKAGGRLVYSTCSILAEENEGVVEAFLAAREDFSLLRPGHVARALLDNRDYFRTYPHRHDMDGFFGAVMKKRERMH